jgi:hypothetical protein
MIVSVQRFRDDNSPAWSCRGVGLVLTQVLMPRPSPRGEARLMSIFPEELAAK